MNGPHLATRVLGRAATEQQWRRLIDDLARHGLLGACGAAPALGAVAEDVRTRWDPNESGIVSDENAARPSAGR